jgi:DNA-binding transcriptional regulator YhcF (GntR family)
MVTLQPDSPIPLVNQIVEGLRALIADQSLKADAKLPSIRAFAASHGVSVFTVVEAYDRLVAQGWLTSRAQSGFSSSGGLPTQPRRERHRPIRASTRVGISSRSSRTATWR